MIPRTLLNSLNLPYNKLFYCHQKGVGGGGFVFVGLKTFLVYTWTKVCLIIEMKRWKFPSNILFGDPPQAQLPDPYTNVPYLFTNIPIGILVYT
jgi:hypothetical protein